MQVISAEPPSTTTTEEPNFDIYSGCDDMKACFGTGDSDCVRNRRCLTVRAVIYDVDKFAFEMQASGEKISLQNCVAILTTLTILAIELAIVR